MRRYDTLDGLRGVAAIVVLAGHAHQWLSPIPRPRAFLAVDLFFVLSGFILANVYEPRFATGMSFLEFAKQRLIRLWPLFVLGAAVGCVSEVIGMMLGHGNLTGAQLIGASISSFFMMPSVTTASSIGDLYPLNHPGWSLFYELAVNALYFLYCRKFAGVSLGWIVATSAAGLITIHIMGLPFSGPSWPAFLAGFPRVIFSFSVGVFIARHSDKTIKYTNWAWLAPIGLAVLLYLLPADRVSGNGMMSRIFDGALVFVGFPLLVGICSKFEPRNGRVFAWLGLISYPLYAIHEPIIYFVWRIFKAVKLDVSGLAPLDGIAVGLLIIALCPVLEAAYDRPLRKLLTRWIDASPRSLTDDIRVGQGAP